MDDASKASLSSSLMSLSLNYSSKYYENNLNRNHV